MGVKKDDVLKKLETIEKGLNAKCHPMQDYSTLKLALLELIEVMKGMIRVCGGKND